MIIAVIVIFLLALLFVYYKLLQYFFTFALCRLEKESNLPSTGIGTIYEEEIMTNRQWLENNDKTVVSCTSFDGLKLIGHFFENKNARRTLIFFHGWRGTWLSDFAPFSEYFNNGDFNLLLIEQRAQGNSEGLYMGMGTLESKDVITWIDWYIMHQKPLIGELPIYLFGVSMGGSSVLMSLKHGLPSDVKGIITDCCFADVYSVFRDFAKKVYHIPEYPLVWHLNRLSIKKIGVNLKSCSPVTALTNSSIPILFVHGQSDDFIPPSHTEFLYDICSSPAKQLLLIEGAPHCMSFLIGRAQYTRSLEQFFN